ncbi:hypothetical protein BDN72DRAFT_876402 [Pluteus cervinus]|uniref:Uncharacterized protein n=1 Tax=Pluteus cervinus TaxID=181527 RepID=A0ACD3B4C2_9AGAR|nr:hypothetical protein BDN72DRAFT_876402 [Pluteus cervinus]
MPDDLDDDFVLDDTVAWSADEHGAPSDLDDQPTPPSDPASASTSAPIKKRKRREKEKERKAKKRKFTESVESIEQSIAAQPPHALSRYISSVQTKTFPKLSAIELGDFEIPEASIADTTSWTGPRTLDQLADFIIKVLPALHTRLSQKSRSTGAPTLLFVTGAALRVVDVTRALKTKKLRGEKGGEVAKLFAKHFKLSEHVAYLKRTKVGAAVGTPGRIGKLLNETDALAASALSHIILDVTFRDSKKRCLLDIPETRDEVFRGVLAGPKLLKAIREGKVQLVLF